MKYFLPFVLFLFMAGRLFAGELSSRDFAAGYYLEVDNKGVVYSLELPVDVYRTVKRADLGDLRVFNGAGELVPHGFRAAVSEKRHEQEQETIPFFPIFRNRQQNDNSDLSLQVTRNTVGTIINMNSAPVSDGLDKEISAYLLDLSGLKQVVSELEFQWYKDTDSSVLTISIQQSSDLLHWKPLVQKATLADLQYGGQRVEQRTVRLPFKQLKYLKLSWKNTDSPLRLKGISGFSQPIQSRQKHQWVPLYNGKVHQKEEQLVVDFETNYRLPASSAKIRFGESNSIAKLSVQSRSGKDSEWQTRCEQLFYHLSLDEVPLHSEPCTFRPVSDPMWRLVVKQDGAGLRSGNNGLTLQLGWTPNELLFIGRGTPPYLLAFGSGKLLHQEQKTDSDMILQAVEKESSKQLLKKVRLGKRINLGGEAALQEPPAKPPWKKWLLWIVLTLGVGLLAFMARSLVKEMKSSEEKKVSNNG